MVKGGGNDKSIRDFDLFSLQPAFSGENAHRSAIGAVTGRIRPSNQGRKVPSSHSCKPSRRLLAGSTVMPLRISPREMTLKYNSALLALSSQRSTSGADFRRVSSDGMLVSSRKPLIAERRGHRVSLEIDIETIERRLREQLREALSAFRPLRSSRGGRLGRRRGPEGLHDHILDIVERAAAHPFPDERFEFRAVNFNRHDRRLLIQLCCHT
jgi:hypothetical protein